MDPTRRDRRLRELAETLASSGANLTLVVPGAKELPVGRDPGRARVAFHDPRALDALLGGDHLATAEAYLAGAIDLEGDSREAIGLLDAVDMDTPWTHRLAQAARLLLRDRLAYDRESIAVQYDLPPEFYLAWLDPLRTYSHGFYASPDEPLVRAQRRKLQYVVDALGLEPGMEVLDMGSGWGCFVEYAGRLGIHVRGITISRRQHDYVARLIEREGLPCSVEEVNLLAYRPRRRFDAAVFLGTLEHVPETRRVVSFLREHLADGGRFYADFCASRDGQTIGRFMKRHLWPGPIRYIDVGRLVSRVVAGGFNVHTLEDDTLSYAWTVRDWGDALEASRDRLAALTSEATVRAYLLFLRGSLHMLRTNRIQAHHLVAGTGPSGAPIALRAPASPR